MLDSSASPTKDVDGRCCDLVRLRQLRVSGAAAACGDLTVLLVLATLGVSVVMMGVIGSCCCLGCSADAAGWDRGSGTYMLSSSDDNCTTLRFWRTCWCRAFVELAVRCCSAGISVGGRCWSSLSSEVTTRRRLRGV